MLPSCQQGDWLYYRLFESNKPIDVAFLGSSHTMLAMQDSAIETRLREAGQDLHVANLGFCRLGRNLHYGLVKDLMKTKAPKLVVLEVRNDENRSSHPDFYAIADQRDLLFPRVWLNASILRDYLKGVELRIKYFFRSKARVPQARSEYAYRTNDVIGDTTALRHARYKRIKNNKQITTKGLKNRIELSYPKAYLSKIKALLAEHDAELGFVYIPGFGNPEMPAHYNYYESIGNLFVPPSGILDNMAHWSEKEHLNTDGATAMSQWWVNAYLGQ